eukprot:4552735-Pleurochrysis_carterae.AAC.1
MIWTEQAERKHRGDERQAKGERWSCLCTEHPSTPTHCQRRSEVKNWGVWNGQNWGVWRGQNRE